MKKRNAHCLAKVLFISICFGIGCACTCAALVGRFRQRCEQGVVRIFGNWDPDGTPSRRTNYHRQPGQRGQRHHAGRSEFYDRFADREQRRGRRYQRQQIDSKRRDNDRRLRREHSGPTTQRGRSNRPRLRRNHGRCRCGIELTRRDRVDRGRHRGIGKWTVPDQSQRRCRGPRHHPPDQRRNGWPGDGKLRTPVCL